MSTLGIITCEILELEMAHLLSEARVGSIAVLDSPSAHRLLGTLETLQVDAERIPHLHSHSPDHDSSAPGVLLQVLPIALHRNRDLLRRKVHAAAIGMRPHVDALLVGYGNCGGALRGATGVLDNDIPLFFPTDEGAPLDDCVGISLGRTCYQRERRETPGTYFATVGWCNHWKQMFGSSTGVSSAMVQRVFARYERLVIVESAVMTERLRARAEELCRLAGLRSESVAGSVTRLGRALNAALEALRPRHAK